MFIPRLHKMPMINEEDEGKDDVSNVDGTSERGITSARSLDDISDTYTSHSDSSAHSQPSDTQRSALSERSENSVTLQPPKHHHRASSELQQSMLPIEEPEIVRTKSTNAVRFTDSDDENN